MKEANEAAKLKAEEDAKEKAAKEKSEQDAAAKLEAEREAASSTETSSETSSKNEAAVVDAHIFRQIAETVDKLKLTQESYAQESLAIDAKYKKNASRNS